MGVLKRIIATVIGLGFLLVPDYSQSSGYLWLNCHDHENSIFRRIPPLAGYRRIPVEAGSFAEWLRHLPLKKGKPRVFLFNRQPKENQSAHVAVIDIDTGNRDLQQCADAIIRLRSEYLFSRGKTGDIHFRFTSGHTAKFQDWVEGFRPVVSENEVKWGKSSPADSSYANFRNYLETVFFYAGTHSLAGELTRVRNISDMQIGDIFIQAGFPGHAVLVVDMAVHARNGNKIFLLAQSFMPAQDVHVLKNLRNQQLNPWYELASGGMLKTPEWGFYWDDLRRF